MAEQQDFQERTEQPTRRRLDEARKKGQVPRSRELNTLLSLLVAVVGFLVLGERIVDGLAHMAANGLTLERELAFDSRLILPHFGTVALHTLLVLTPFFALMMAGAFVGPLGMGGWTFSWSAMNFKLEKISPVKGIKRIFSAKGLLELGKALFKFVLVATAALLLFMFLIDRLLQLSGLPLHQALSSTLWIFVWSLLVLSSVLALIALVDVPFQLWDHSRQLKMSRQEVRDELKETEGRPEVKSRIRNLQREISQRRMMEAVPTADVVITNPTHYAVALKYDSQSSAPIVVAKGRDLIAAQIRHRAEENGVVLFSAPPLARALYASTKLNQQIPENLYLAVAKVLAYVYQLNNLGYGQRKPDKPDDLPVPDDYFDGYFDDYPDDDGDINESREANDDLDN